MALSGTLNSSKYCGRYLQFSWTATQNVTGNYSDISWTLKGAGESTESGVNYYKAGNFKVTIAGTKVYSSSSRISLYNGTTVTSGTKRIYHNDTTGAASFKVEIEAGIYYTAVNCSGSTTFTLDVIPRHPNIPSITSPSAGIISEKSTSIAVSWNTTNRGTYTLEVCKNGGAWSTVKSDIAIGTLSYSYSITPSQGDTYVFRVKAVYSGLSSSYSTSGTVTINKLTPPTIGTLGTFNPYVNSTYNVPLSGGSQSNGGGFKRCCNIHVDGNYKYAGTYPSSNNNTSVNITVSPSSIISDLGTTSYSSSTRFTIVAWTENSNGTRSSYVSKAFTVNINSDGGATPTVASPIISGGLFGYDSTCFIAGVNALTVKSGNVTMRRASGGHWSYKIEVTGYSAVALDTKKYENLTAGVKTIKVTVTDSRGLSSSVSTQIRVQAYAPPTIKDISGSRLADPNTSAQVSYQLSYSPIYAYNTNVDTQGTQLNGINSQQYSLNNGSWSTYASGKTITGLDAGATHTINLRITDKVQTSNYISSSVLIPTVIVPFSIRRHGIGIRCIPQSGYALDVNGTIRTSYSNGTVIIKNGCMELLGETPYIDFHYGNSSDDYNVRLINQVSGQLTLVGNLNVQGRIHQQYVSIPADSDMNTYIASGIYLCNEGSSYKNSPDSTYGNGILEVIHLTTGLMKQIYTRYDGASWQRVCWFSTWYAWRKITD